MSGPDAQRVSAELGILVSQADALALTLLAKSAGYASVGPMLEEAISDSVAAGWCTSCHTPAGECEPDARENWCEHCGAQSVASCLVLAGII